MRLLPHTRLVNSPALLTDTRLPAGFLNIQSYLGLGPGGNSTPPIWRLGGYLARYADVIATIAAADAAGVILLANFSDSRGNWTVAGAPGCLTYVPATYESQVRRFTVAGGASAAVAAAITDALARKRMWAYVVDEPKHPSFCGSISDAQINQMGLVHKTIWPGCMCVIRTGIDDLGSPPGGGWTGLDYAISQYEGPHFPSFISGGVRPQESYATFYAREKAGLAIVNLGMIPGNNLQDGGFWIKTDTNNGVPTCWNYLNDTVPSSGVIMGTLAPTVAQRGLGAACSTLPGSAGTRMHCPPDQIRAFADAVWNDPDAPFVVQWTHVYPTFQSDAGAQTRFATLEGRSDFVAAFDYLLDRCNSRPSANALRTPK